MIITENDLKAEINTPQELFEFINSNLVKNKFTKFELIKDICESLMVIEHIRLSAFKILLRRALTNKYGRQHHKIVNTSYWIIRGYSSEEAKQFVTNEQKRRCSRMTKDKYIERTFNTPISRVFWEKKGLNQIDIDKIMSKIQGRGREFYRAKGLSEDAIDIKIKIRNIKWQESLAKKLKIDDFNKRKGRTYQQLIDIYGEDKANLILKRKLSGFSGVSDISQNAIEEIIAFCEIDKSECFYGENEYFIHDGSNFFRYDFKYRNIMIEFNGDFWHMSPMLYEYNDINCITKTSAKVVWERDKLKGEAATKRGFNLITLWESEWRRDKDTLLVKIKNIINEENKNKNTSVI
jgi:hypothetical protein